jgi:hypothetical protein
MALEIHANGGGSATFAYADTEPNGLPAVSDTATALLALIFQSRGAQTEASREDVEHANQVIEQTRRELQEALKRAAEAEDHSGFWNKLSQVINGDIGALCEVVASVAVIAATGGVGTAGVLAIAAAGLALGSDVAQRAGVDPKLCLGLSAAGALAGLALGNVGDAPAFWATVVKGSEFAHAAAGAAGAGATVASTEYHADALDAQTDATDARNRQTDALFDYDLALDVLERAARDTSRAEASASNISQIENDARTTLIARLGAA